MPLVVTTLQALTEGVAAQLAAHADPALGIAWDPNSDYSAGQLGIWAAYIPTDPDRIISLSPRQLTADPTLADSTYALQIRLRGTTDPYDVWAIRDGIRDTLLGRWPVAYPNGLAIKTVDFAGGTSLGPDARDRWQWSENFVFGLGEHRARPF